MAVKKEPDKHSSRQHSAEQRRTLGGAISIGVERSICMYSRQARCDLLATEPRARLPWAHHKRRSIAILDLGRGLSKPQSRSRGALPEYTMAQSGLWSGADPRHVLRYTSQSQAHSTPDGSNAQAECRDTKRSLADGQQQSLEKQRVAIQGDPKAILALL